MDDDLLSEEDDVFHDTGITVKGADKSDTSGSTATIVIDTDSDMENPSISLKKLLSKRIKGLQSSFSQQSSTVRNVFLQRMETILPRMLEEISKMPVEIQIQNPDSSSPQFHFDIPDTSTSPKRKKYQEEQLGIKADIPKHRLHLHVMQLWILALQRTFRDGMHPMHAAEREINNLCGLVVQADKFLSAQSESYGQVPFRRLGHFEWVKEAAGVVDNNDTLPRHSSSSPAKQQPAKASPARIVSKPKPLARKRVLPPPPVAVNLAQSKPTARKTVSNASDDCNPIKPAGSAGSRRRLLSSSEEDVSDDAVIVLPETGIQPRKRGVKRKERSVERWTAKSHISPRVTRSKSMITPLQALRNRRSTRSMNRMTGRARTVAEPDSSSTSGEESSAESDAESGSASESEDDEVVDKGLRKRGQGFIGSGSLRRRNVLLSWDEVNML